MSNITSSERKGVMIVAAIALIVTLCGLGVKWCSRPAKTVTPAEVEMLIAPDSVDAPYSDTSDTSFDNSRSSKARMDSAREKEWDQQWRNDKFYEHREKIKRELGKKLEDSIDKYRRSPLDEPLPLTPNRHK